MKEHAYSEGARYERAAIRTRLRREIAKEPNPTVAKALQEEVDWILARQKRYEKVKGGLGTK